MCKELFLNDQMHTEDMSWENQPMSGYIVPMTHQGPVIYEGTIEEKYYDNRNLWTKFVDFIMGGEKV